MRPQKLLFMLLLSCLSPMTLGEGDPVAGKQKSVVCAGCHGVDGHSADPNIPKLAGQLQGYIVMEVIYFQEGIRGDSRMTAVAMFINKYQNPQDLEDIAAYFSTQEPMRGQATNSSLVIEGEALFTSKHCNYCHGDGGHNIPTVHPLDIMHGDGRHNVRKAPVIGGQHKPYLVNAIHDIRDGKRPGDVYDLMVQLFSDMSEKQIEAIAEYLSSL